ncbi:glycosyltransferase [Burkholderia sp. Bp9031]|uniref:glycosyltransferase family 2 protein n=1 Tax=Burkholderia sp. Bp9031 TaxID=2184566 RepID=UPI000F5F09C3|nr:galactosyltransferase-related protein [Burkholderia sp. Bp9031]RQZ06074.1 glycosyltransferase [Burkholderia sp. Bp9031]
MSTLEPLSLDIVVTWRGRHELRQALPSLCQLAARHDGGVTVVNYGGDADQLRDLMAEHAANVQVVHVDESGWFNKARAQNIGAAHTRRPLLFFCDCDIVIPDGQLDALVRQLQANPDTFGTVAGVTETVRNARKAGQVAMFGYQLKLRLANGRALEIIDNEEDAADGTRQAPGLLMVRRAGFECIGGYNGYLVGWGWEDQDMIARLTLSAGLTRRQSGAVLHVSHDDNARIRHYPPVQDRWESRDRMFRQALANYDRGDWLGTYEEDALRSTTRSPVSAS